MDFILIFQAVFGFNSFTKGGKFWGENCGIVAHLNRANSAVESSFNELNGPRFSR